MLSGRRFRSMWRTMDSKQVSYVTVGSSFRNTNAQVLLSIDTINPERAGIVTIIGRIRPERRRKKLSEIGKG